MNKKTSIIICLIATLLFLATDNTAKEATGLIEISQKDMPLTITEPGSYILVSNLSINDADITAIFITTNNVTIDLNGFTIKGPGKGSGGMGFAINTDVNNNIVIQNGSVKDFGYVGVHLPGNNNTVENVRVSHCAGQGIFAGRCSVIQNCQVAFCMSGVNTDDGSMVINNTLYSNQASGIFTSGDAPGPVGGVTVIGNNCRLNWIGIRVKGEGCQIEGNTVTENGVGINLTDGANNYFARNVLVGNSTAVIGESDDLDGGSIAAALSNIILY